MSRRIVKVQLPLAGEKAALVYDEDRKFVVIVDDPDGFAAISQNQNGDPKAYWHAEIDDETQAFALQERAPEQEW